jgi:hypothetical protein
MLFRNYEIIIRKYEIIFRKNELFFSRVSKSFCNIYKEGIETMFLTKYRVFKRNINI